MRFTIALAAAGLAAASAAAQSEGSFTPLPTVKPLSAAESGIDGRVNGLNAAAYDALAQIRARGIFVGDDRVAPFVRDALLKDGAIDAAEADLLNEMTQPAIRAITITRAGAKPGEPTIIVGTTGGRAKTLYFETLFPPAALAAAFAKGESEWPALVRSARTNVAREDQITKLLADQLAGPAQESNAANAFKPFARAVSGYFVWTKAVGTDPDMVMASRILIYRAAQTADQRAENRMPDFVYNWLKTPPKAAN